MISLAFTGDIMLSRRVKDNLQKNPDFNILTPSLINYLNDADYVIGNLECPVASLSSPISSKAFKAQPDAINQLKSFDLLTLANNHIFDCGKEGARETSKFLIEKRKDQCGLIYDKKQMLGVEKQIQDKKIQIISSAVKECIKDQNTSNFPKVWCAEDDSFFKTIQKEVIKNDYTILIIHGGNEMIPYPEPSFRNLCKKYIDAGVDVVVTHHPHVLGGMEEYNGGLIFYSLGDFVFDGQSYIRRRGAVLKLFFQKNKIEWEIKPISIKKDLSVDISNEKVSLKIINKWNKISKILLKHDYNQKYIYRYITSLISFQIDRIFFLLRNENLGVVLFFILDKTKLIPFYFFKIIKNKVK